MDLVKEREIIKDFQSGNKKAFEALYKEYYNDVYRYTYALLNDKDNSQDMCQKVFLTAYEKLEKFEDRGVSVKHWIIRIARMLLYRGIDKSQIPYEDDIKVDTSESLDGNVSTVDIGMQKDIAEALSMLPNVTREIIVLKVWDEYTFSEISDLTDLEVGNVKMQFYRGISKMREILEKKATTEVTLYSRIFSRVLWKQEDWRCLKRVSRLLLI